MKKFTSKRQKTGLIGEKAAENYLVKQGFSITDRNYSTRFGEIDIIAKRDNRLYFFEIKTVSVSCETKPSTAGTDIHGSRETFLRENRKLENPFQNISYLKIKRLAKTAEIYLQTKNISPDIRWQIDGVGVYLDPVSHETKIIHIENISIL
jgi:putative endonuclease